jgi:TrmH family RNA methyltransferase
MNFQISSQIKEQELRKISFLKNPSKSLALVKLPENIEIQTDKLQIVLDEIQDPGNLGTIIRLCDWFGIEQIVCSNTTVDVFNPKCVQASMGSIFRVNIFYTDLLQHFNNHKLPIISTTLDGENVFQTELPKSWVLDSRKRR